MQWLVRNSHGDNLALLRNLFVAFASSIVLFGAAITLLRMAAFAPTTSALTRMQDDLAAQGCSRSLVAALRQVPPK